MISGKVKLVGLTKAATNLQQIHTKDIPQASAAAYRWAGKRAITRVSKQLAASLRVPVWMIRGQKGKGSRFGLSRYKKKIDGGHLHFRTRHLNPAGTKHKAAKVTTLKRGVRATRRTYKDSFADTFKFGPAIWGRGRNDNLFAQRIEIDEGHISQVKRNVRRIYPAAYKRRFEHEFNRRLKRRGSR